MRNPKSNFGLYLALGMALGAVVGQVMGSMGVGISIGVILALALSSVRLFGQQTGDRAGSNLANTCDEVPGGTDGDAGDGG